MVIGTGTLMGEEGNGRREVWSVVVRRAPSDPDFSCTFWKKIERHLGNLNRVCARTKGPTHRRQRRKTLETSSKYHIVAARRIVLSRLRVWL